MFANPEKFQAIVVQHNKSINENYTLKVNNIETKSKNSVKLLGIGIVNKLLFDKYIVSLCKKAANQLHAICRLQNQKDKMEKQVLVPCIAYSYFNYSPLLGHFCSKKLM